MAGGPNAKPSGRVEPAAAAFCGQLRGAALGIHSVKLSVLKVKSQRRLLKTSFKGHCLRPVLLGSLCSRHLLKRSYLRAVADDLEHPIVQAMLSAGLLVPRWAPLRLEIPRATQSFLAKWIDQQHSELSWPQRLEYNVELLRERAEIIRQLDRLEKKPFQLRSRRLNASHCVSSYGRLPTAPQLNGKPRDFRWVSRLTHGTS